MTLAPHAGSNSTLRIFFMKSDMKILRIIQKTIGNMTFWPFLAKFPYNWLSSPPALGAQWAERRKFEKWKWPKIMKTWYFHQVKSVFDLKQAAIRIKTDFGSHLHPLEVWVFHENIEILWFLACDTPGHLPKGWYELELTFCSFLSYWCWIYSKKRIFCMISIEKPRKTWSKREKIMIEPQVFSRKMKI